MWNCKSYITIINCTVYTNNIVIRTGWRVLDFITSKAYIVCNIYNRPYKVMFIAIKLLHVVLSRSIHTLKVHTY